MKRLFICCVFLLVYNSSVFAQDGDVILGNWFTSSENSTVEIYKCGKKYCGKISWLKNPTYEDGSEKVDENNPDESKKNRKILGLDIVYGFKYKGENKWANGKIYDPDNGKTYSCKMTFEGKELHVRGFIGIALIGRTTVWKRKVDA
jgi:uncharacterized protein (DUF2147 family)